jgi:hypothetical protein
MQTGLGLEAQMLHRGRIFAAGACVAGIALATTAARAADF